MAYKPRPIDTSGVTLPRDLLELIELLAQSNHDVWSRQRILEGWSYGDERDDRRKKHPDLIPYSGLSEREKDYDRNSATETLKAILKLGYRIEAPLKDQMSDVADRVLSEALKRLRSRDKLDLIALRAIWNLLSSLPATGLTEAYELLANRILKVGEPLLAYDVIVRGLECWPTSLRLRQLLGLALVGSGAVGQANAVLHKLYIEGHTDGETLGILARTHKDLWEQSRTAGERQTHLHKAHEIYRKAYRFAVRRGAADDQIYAGINAATTALLLGQEQRARSLARRVSVVCREKQELEDDYWAEATLGEVALILNQPSEAEDRYRRAAELGRGNYADLSTTRRHARIVAQHQRGDEHWFDHLFGIPKVIFFAGHMIDQPGRPKPRFPGGLVSKVRREIAAKLREYDDKIGYSGAAPGSDILFLEAMQEQGAETNVVLPFPEERFCETHAANNPRSGWGKRFRQVMNRSASLMVASEQHLSDSFVAYHYSNLLQDGLARLRAQMLDTEVIPLVVWDGRAGDGPGGTASLVKHWRSQGLEPEIVDMRTILMESASIRSAQRNDRRAASAIPRSKRIPRGFRQEIMALLFADVVGYTRLTEEEIPRFVKHFMKAVANLVDKSRHTPVTRYTWGDAMYFVFASVRDAGNLALELREMVFRTDWMKRGLPKNLSLRIALHAGPVYSCVDPVSKLPTYTGVHVSRAARVEPITPPGLVYASQAFAALAAAGNVTGFACDYVGQTQLAKGYGIFPMYHVRRC